MTAHEPYRVYAKGQLIGTTHLESADRDMAVAYGVFTPLPDYEAVRPIFQALTEALDAHNMAATTEGEYVRDDLSLTLVSPDGSAVEAGWIHIRDFTATIPDAPLEVEAHVPDPAFWASRASPRETIRATSQRAQQRGLTETRPGETVEDG